MSIATVAARMTEARLIPNRGAYFYHGTSSKRLKSVLKNGLHPSYSGEQWSGQDDTDPGMRTLGGVYLARDYRVADASADYAASGDDSFPVVLVVRVSPGVKAGLDEDNLPAAYDLFKSWPLYSVAKIKSELGRWTKSFLGMLSLRTNKGNPKLLAAVQNYLLAYVRQSNKKGDWLRGIVFWGGEEFSDELLRKYRHRLSMALDPEAIYNTEKEPLSIRVQEPVTTSSRNAMIVAGIQSDRQGHNPKVLFGSLPPGVRGFP